MHDPSRGVPATLFASLLLLASSAWGQSWDPFPRLPAGQQVAVKASLDGRQYDELRSCLGGLDSAVGASYFAVVVEVSAATGSPSPSESDAVPYVDALYQAWRPGGRLDPETHVLIAMALKNRAVAVHPGSRWADLGLEGREIRRVIDRSRFGDFARGGDFGRALCALAADVDKDLAKRQAALDEKLAQAATERQRLEALGARLTSGDLTAELYDDARALVGTCGARLEEVEGRLAKGDAADVSGVKGCVDRMAREIEIAAELETFVYVVVPLLVVGLLVVIVVVVFLVQRWRRRRARQRVDQELERWRQDLGSAAERLLDLERKNPLFFATGALRWSGESKALEEDCADAVNRVFLLYSEACRLRDEAERTVLRARGFRTKPYDDVYELLRTTAVRFETGEPARGDGRRIFAPLKQQYEGTALTLLADLEKAYAEAVELLAKVEEIDSRLRQLGEEADEAASAATLACRRRGELGFATSHLSQVLEPILERRQTVDAAASDPLQAIATLESCLADLGSLTQRAEGGNAVALRLRGPVVELGQSLRRRLEELRGEGFRLTEPGFDPDLRLDRGVRDAAAIEEAIAAGREDDAAAALTELELSLDELSEQLEAIYEAREGVPVAVSAIEAEAAALKDRLPATRSILETLNQEHAAEAFREEADNVEELERLLGELERWVDHIRDDHRTERYLSALADLEACERLVQKGTDLVEEVERVEERLDQARKKSRELVGTCGRLLEDLAGERGAPGLGRTLERLIGERGDACRRLLTDAEAERPDWLRLESELEAAVQELEGLLRRAVQARASYDECRDLERRLSADLEALDREVQSERRDRPHVAQAVAQVEERLAAWRRDLEAGEQGGEALKRPGAEVEKALEWARGVWRSEMDAIHLAQSQLAAARATFDREDDRSFGYGISADCGGARRLLSQAEQAGQSRDWEAVLSLARQAEGEIASEIDRCRREADERQEEERRELARLRALERQEEERRERERQRELARQAAAAQQSLAASVSSFSSAPSPPPSRRTTSSSSFGSRRGGSFGSRPSPPSGGGSRPSSSGGGGFGGSRSGGSSW